MRDLFYGYQIGRAISESIKTNARLAQIISDQDAQQLAQQQLSQLLDGLLQFRAILRQAAQAVEGEPVHACWRMLEFQQWCHAGGVSSGSFQQVSDKEVFQECQALANDIQRRAKQQLSHEQMETLEKNSKALVVASSLRMYLIWNHIYERMRHCAWFPAIATWNGSGTIVAMILGGIFAPPAFGLVLIVILTILQIPDPVVGIASLLTVILFPIFSTIAYYKRSKLAPRLNQLAQTVGGHISTKTRIKDLRGFPESLRADVARLGVPTERMGEADLLELYQREAQLIHASNETYQLGINVGKYPLTIPLGQ